MTTITTPILSKLNFEKQAGNRFDAAIDTLNASLTAKKIWNSELSDVKYTLSNGVDRALNIICERDRSKRNLDSYPYRYEEWQKDFSGYCGFNQAAGRIKRLTKKAPKTAVVSEYLAALAEVVAIWNAIVALKPFVVKGRKPNQNKTEAQIAEELRNTGMCGICSSRQKLNADKLVKHGYEMSEYNHSGVQVGKCFGVGYLAYELSNESCVAYAPVLERERKATMASIKLFKSGTIKTITATKYVWEKGRQVEKMVTLFSTGETAADFQKEIESVIYQRESELRMVNNAIKSNKANIDNWTLQPLKYGR